MSKNKASHIWICLIKTRIILTVIIFRGCGGRIRTFCTDSQFEGSKFKWGLIVISGLVRSPAHHWAIWFNLNFATASRSGNKNWNKRKTLISLRWDGYIALVWAPGFHVIWLRRLRREKSSKVMLCLSDVCYDCRITFSLFIYQTSDWTFLSSTRASEKIVTAAFFWPGVDVLIRIINEQKNWIRCSAP